MSAVAKGSRRFRSILAPLARVDASLIALAVVGYVLASYKLGTKGFWLDEAISADHARLSFSSLLNVISHRDPNMGLYYVLLHFWVRVFGYSEAGVRSLSVVLGGLAIPAIAVLGRRLLGRPAGLAAGLLLATGPYYLQFEQTARSYTLVVLLVTLSSIMFLEELERHSPWTQAGYVVTSALAIYAHYFAALVLLVQGLALLAVKRRSAFERQWLISAAAIVLLGSPEVAFAARAGAANPSSWISRPTLASLTNLPGQLAGGRALGALLAVLAVFGFVSEARRGRTWRVGFLAAWFLVPVLLDFEVSRLGRPLFVSYYLIVVVPAWLLLAGAGIARIPIRAVAVAAVLVVVVVAGLRIHHWYDHPSLEGFRAATRYILTNQQTGDAIIEYPPGTLLGPTSALSYYEAQAGRPGPAPVRFDPRGAVSTAHARVWLAMRPSDVPRRTRLWIEHTLATTYQRVGEARDFYKVTVLLYRSRVALSTRRG